MMQKMYIKSLFVLKMELMYQTFALYLVVEDTQEQQELQFGGSLEEVKEKLVKEIKKWMD